MASVLAIGLPDAGKTTFLAALWHVTESEEVPGALRLERISENAKHLNSIRNDWLRLERVVRTVPGQEQPTTLWLRDDRRLVGEVLFPDLSGESFEGAWTDRHWTKEYEQFVSGAGSLLVFAHPGTLKEPHTIAEMQRMMEAALPEDVQAEREVKHFGARDEATVEIASEEWLAENAPTQVQLVDLLQFTEKLQKAERPVRVGVIVSAWDLVFENYPGEMGAGNWLKNRMSYLDQYLRSNFELFNVRVYGVSAQGGDLEKDRAALQNHVLPSERIVIHGPDCVPHDISEPVRWCLGLRGDTAL
jgi:Double-GTPase 1